MSTIKINNSKGLNLKKDETTKEKDSYGFALNAVSLDKDIIKLTNENSNEFTSIIGLDGIGNNIIGKISGINCEFVFSVRLKKNADDTESTLYSELGKIDERGKYIRIFNDSYYKIEDNFTEKQKEEYLSKQLKFNINYPISGVYRESLNGSKYLYWTDNYNVPRKIDLKSLNLFLDIFGDNTTINSDKINYFTLPVTNTEISKIDILSNGKLYPGKYKFFIKLEDSLGNSTDYFSETKSIFITDKEDISGTFHIDFAERKVFPVSKSIKLIIDNLDSNIFSYFTIGIVEYRSQTGEPTYARESKKIPLNGSYSQNFIYDGTNYEKDINIEEIIIDNVILNQVKNLSEKDNRLILSNVRENSSFHNHILNQNIASKIKTSVIRSKEYDLDNVNSEDYLGKETILNDFKIGYTPGEVYSLGIKFIDRNNRESPVYHIPGPSQSITWNDSYYTSNEIPMDNYITESIYIPKVSAPYKDSEDIGYWGTDSEGNILEKTPVRHHRIPEKLLENTFIKSTKVGNIQNTSFLTVNFTIRVENPDKTQFSFFAYSDIPQNSCNVNFTNNNLVIESSLEIKDSLYIIAIDQSNGSKCSLTLKVNNDETYFEVKNESGNYINQFKVSDSNNNLFFNTLDQFEDDTLDLDYRIAKFYIKLTGIEFPEHIDKNNKYIGYKICKNVKNENNRYFLDSGYILPLTQTNKIVSFGNILPLKAEPINKNTMVYAMNKSCGRFDITVTGAKDHPFLINSTAVSNPFRGMSDDEDGNKYKDLYLKTPDIENSFTQRIGDIGGIYLDSNEDKNNLNISKNYFGIVSYLNLCNRLNYSTIDFKIIGNYNIDVPDCIHSISTHRGIDEKTGSDSLKLRLFSKFLKKSEFFNQFNIENSQSNVKVKNIENLKKVKFDDKVIYNVSSDMSVMVFKDKNYKEGDSNNSPLYDFMFKSFSDSLHYKIPKIIIFNTLGNLHSDFSNEPYEDETKIIKFENKNITQTNISNGDLFVSTIGVNTSHTLGECAFAETPDVKGWFKTFLGGALAAIGIVLSFTGVGAVIGVGLTSIGLSLITTDVYTNLKVDKINDYLRDLKQEAISSFIDSWYREYIPGNVKGFSDNTWRNTSNDVREIFCKLGPDSHEVRYANYYLNNLLFLSNRNITKTINTLGVNNKEDIPKLNLKKTNTFGRFDAHTIRLSVKNLENSKSINYVRNKYLIVNDTEKAKTNYIFLGCPLPTSYIFHDDYFYEKPLKPSYALSFTSDISLTDIAKYQNRLYFSDQTLQDSIIDNYKNIKPNNYIDILSTKGSITNTFILDNTLYIHTEKSLFKLPNSKQEVTRNEIVTYIGGEDIFSMYPQELSSSFINNLGTLNKYSNFLINNKYYFLSEFSNSIWELTSSSLKEISSFGNVDEFFDEIKLNINENTPYSNYLSSNLIGYNNSNKSILITKKHKKIDGVDEEIDKIWYNGKYWVLPNYKDLINDCENGNIEVCPVKTPGTNIDYCFKPNMNYDGIEIKDNVPNLKFTYSYEVPDENATEYKRENRDVTISYKKSFSKKGIIIYNIDRSPSMKIFINDIINNIENSFKNTDYDYYIFNVDFRGTDTQTSNRPNLYWDGAYFNMGSMLDYIIKNNISDLSQRKRKITIEDLLKTSLITIVPVVDESCPSYVIDTNTDYEKDINFYNTYENQGILFTENQKNNVDEDFKKSLNFFKNSNLKNVIISPIVLNLNLTYDRVDYISRIDFYPFSSKTSYLQYLLACYGGKYGINLKKDKLNFQNIDIDYKLYNLQYSAEGLIYKDQISIFSNSYNERIIPTNISNNTFTVKTSIKPYLQERNKFYIMISYKQPIQYSDTIPLNEVATVRDFKPIFSIIDENVGKLSYFNKSNRKVEINLSNVKVVWEDLLKQTVYQNDLPNTGSNYSGNIKPDKDYFIKTQYISFEISNLDKDDIYSLSDLYLTFNCNNLNNIPFYNSIAVSNILPYIEENGVFKRLFPHRNKGYTFVDLIYFNRNIYDLSFDKTGNNIYNKDYKVLYEDTDKEDNYFEVDNITSFLKEGSLIDKEEYIDKSDFTNTDFVSINLPDSNRKIEINKLNSENLKTIKISSSIGVVPSIDYSIIAKITNNDINTFQYLIPISEIFSIEKIKSFLESLPNFFIDINEEKDINYKVTEIFYEKRNQLAFGEYFIPFNPIKNPVITDNSFTLSYDINKERFISFHSYIPDMYLNVNNEMFTYKQINTKRNNSIWKHNIKDKYLKFYDENRPFIVEPFINSSETFMMDYFHYNDLTQDKLKKVLKEETFNKLWFYNSRQSSGIRDITKEQSINNYYLRHSILDLNKILIEKDYKDWYINTLKDLVLNNDDNIIDYIYSFNKDLNSFIDKLPIEVNIDLNNYNKISPFIDYYFKIRLIYDKFVNTSQDCENKITFNDITIYTK